MKPLLVAILLATVAYCGAAPILPEEAKNHVGENSNVRGLVEQVSFSQKGHAFLNSGGRYPKQVFTGFIPAQNVRSRRPKVPPIPGWQSGYLIRKDRVL
jgi:hypothetical protein